jgi:hypothetical protein
MQEDLMRAPEITQNVYKCYNKNRSIDTEAACYGFWILLFTGITLSRVASGGVKNI